MITRPIQRRNDIIVYLDGFRDMVKIGFAKDHGGYAVHETLLDTLELIEHKTFATANISWIWASTRCRLQCFLAGDVTCASVAASCLRGCGFTSTGAPRDAATIHAAISNSSQYRARSTGCDRPCTKTAIAFSGRETGACGCGYFVGTRPMLRRDRRSNKARLRCILGLRVERLCPDAAFAENANGIHVPERCHIGDSGVKDAGMPDQTLMHEMHTGFCILRRCIYAVTPPECDFAPGTFPRIGEPGIEPATPGRRHFEQFLQQIDKRVLHSGSLCANGITLTGCPLSHAC